jgi:hypothetical protein
VSKQKGEDSGPVERVGFYTYSLAREFELGLVWIMTYWSFDVILSNFLHGFPYKAQLTFEPNDVNFLMSANLSRPNVIIYEWTMRSYILCR